MKRSTTEISKGLMNFGRVMVCNGCCCGNPKLKNLEVPISYLEQAWQKYDLTRDGLGLTISGCIGVCTPANVVCIVLETESMWLVGLDKHMYYEDIVRWVKRIKKLGRIVPLPKRLQGHKIVQRFRL